MIIALTLFLGELDKRADEQIMEKYKHAKKRIQQHLGMPLDSVPPKNAPSWKINQDWLKGNSFYIILTMLE